MATTPRRDVLQRIDTVSDLRRALSNWAMYSHLAEPTSLGPTAVEVWRMAHACADHATSRTDPTEHNVWTGLAGRTITWFRQSHAGRNPDLGELHTALREQIHHHQRRYDPDTATLLADSPDAQPTGSDGPVNDALKVVDRHVAAVAAVIGGYQSQVVSEDGRVVLLIHRSVPPNPDEPMDRAGIDPAGPNTPHPMRWWAELADGSDARFSDHGPDAEPHRVDHWIHTQIGDMLRRQSAQTAATEPHVWFLSAEELDATRTKMEQLNRRATSKGFTGNLQVQAVPATRSHTPGAGAAQVSVHGFEVSITGDPPHYAGWQFLAAVDTVAAPSGHLDIRPLIRGVDGTGWPDQGQPLHPGERRVHSVTRTDPAGVTDQVSDHDTRQQAEQALQRLQQQGIVVRYLPGASQELDHGTIRAGECDHCHTQRDRTSVLIVRNTDSGETKQVGRSCVKDFLGWSTLPVLIDPDQAARAIQHGGSLTGANWDLTSVITYSWAVVETHGWVPASHAGNRAATKDLVAEAITGRGKHAEGLRASIASNLEQGREMAPRIIADLTNAFSESGGGYEANMSAILRSGQVHPRKHLGLAVSAVQAWHRQQEHAAADQVRAAAHQQAADRAALQRHAGTVGEPIVMTGTVTVKRSVDGYRWNSPTQVLLVIDCGDAVAKMITTASWAYQVKLGEQLTVQGTVKAHETYNDVPQTVLVRPKQLPSADPMWETVAPVTPTSRFQEAPLATQPARPRALGI